MPSEFDLIRQHLSRPAPQAVLGVGDDGALMQPSPGQQLVASTDMLVSGTHFLPDTDPERLGWKALAVNVSDLAAMGAQPRWALLALALPAADETWVAAFANGFRRCAERFGVDLVGGDTTRGPLCLSVTILGEVPAGQALLRSGAHVGDDIWVSGSPGLAALGLAHLQGRRGLSAPDASVCLDALEMPQPRVALGLALRDIATAAIDVSDGLLADLGHVLEASGVAAQLSQMGLPRHPILAQCPDREQARRCLLGGGDDYELVFTAPPVERHRLAALAKRLDLLLSRFGSVVAGEPRAMWLEHADGRLTPLSPLGFDHFA